MAADRKKSDTLILRHFQDYPPRSTHLPASLPPCGRLTVGLRSAYGRLTVGLLDLLRIQDGRSFNYILILGHFLEPFGPCRTPAEWFRLLRLLHFRFAL